MLKDFGRRVGMGALTGAAVGVLCLLVGLLRAVVAIILGEHVSPLKSEDIKGLAYYVGGFTVAGIVVSAIWPLLTTRFARYLGFSLAGIVVMIAILAADKGGLLAHKRSDWIIAVVLGIFFWMRLWVGSGTRPCGLTIVAADERVLVIGLNALRAFRLRRFNIL